MLSKIKAFFKKANSFILDSLNQADVLIVAFALVFMHNLHWIVEFFYPVTGEPSMVWIYNTIFGLTRGSIVIGYAYLMFRIIFPKMYKYLEESFVNDFNNSSWKNKTSIAILLYLFFLSFFLVSVITM